jgi:hypothetical protein|nr:MAG: hypothetical protein [Bacteriophage sp.]
MKQTISAAGTPVPASVKLGTIFSWAMLFALIMNLKKRLPEPWKDVIPVEKATEYVAQKEINAHLCSAKFHTQALQASRSIDNRRHWQFYIILLYTSMMCMEFRNLGIYRAAFFIYYSFI